MLPLTLLDWVILTLAVGYATYAVTDNDGPLHLFLHVRNGLSRMVDALVARQWIRLASLVASVDDLLSCYVCLSVWIALLILGLHVGQVPFVIEAMAIAGVVVICRTLYSTGVERRDA